MTDHAKITTDQAQSALIFLSAIAYSLECGRSYRVECSDLPWLKTVLELMPKMPLKTAP